MKIMNTFKCLFIILLFSLISLTSLIIQADEKIHGSVCQPANLPQALALGFGSSQLGTTNNSPNNPDDFPAITGPSFFVTCPINLNTEDEHMDAIHIWVEFLDMHSGDVTCTVYSTSISAPTYVETITIENPSTSPPVIRGHFARFHATSRPWYDINVVCALPPQTRIRSFYVYDLAIP